MLWYYHNTILPCSVFIDSIAKTYSASIKSVGRSTTLTSLIIIIFARKIWIYSMSSQEVQGNPNIIKITLRSMDHLTTTTTAGASRRCAVVAAPIPESAWRCWWQSGSLRSRAPKDQRSRAKIVAVELLNRSEASNTKPVIYIDWTRSTTPWSGDRTNPRPPQRHRRDRRWWGGWGGKNTLFLSHTTSP
jgi:hypothetical protein